jgi:hypothetical protein
VTTDKPPLDEYRDGEVPIPRVRSERIFNQWFIRTREGIEVGPYPTREAAEAAAKQLSAMLDGINDPEITRQFIREFMLLK